MHWMLTVSTYHRSDGVKRQSQDTTLHCLLNVVPVRVQNKHTHVQVRTVLQGKIKCQRKTLPHVCDVLCLRNNNAQIQQLTPNIQLGNAYNRPATAIERPFKPSKIRVAALFSFPVGLDRLDVLARATNSA